MKRRDGRAGSSTAPGAKLVYSTGASAAGADSGAVCPRCAADPCRCTSVADLPPAEQRVRVRRERAGRRGRTVTVVTPLFLGRARAAELLRDLKRRCGGGGALKSGATPDGRACHVLEVQGDHVDAVLGRLRELGFPCRRSGG